MSLKSPVPNHNFVPEYQVSGIPYVTSSAASELTSAGAAIHVKLPYVTRWLIVQNQSSGSGNDIKFGFTENGVTGNVTNNYFVVRSGQTTERLEMRCANLFVAKHIGDDNGFRIIAGLTGAPRDHFPLLTGSNSYEGIG